jgi:hypothetical protein
MVMPFDPTSWGNWKPPAPNPGAPYSSQGDYQAAQQAGTNSSDLFAPGPQTGSPMRDQGQMYGGNAPGVTFNNPYTPADPYTSSDPRFSYGGVDYGAQMYGARFQAQEANSYGRQAPSVNYGATNEGGDYSQYGQYGQGLNATIGSQYGLANEESRIAAGGATGADYALQNATDKAIATGQAQANSARGGYGLGEAQRTAATNTAGITANNATSMGQQKFAEEQAARGMQAGIYGNIGQENLQGGAQALSARGQDIGQAQFGAGLGMTQEQLNQAREMGYLGAEMGVNSEQLGANMASAGADQAWNAMRYGAQNQFNNAMIGAGASLGGKLLETASDIRAKDDITPIGNGVYGYGGGGQGGGYGSPYDASAPTPPPAAYAAPPQGGAGAQFAPAIGSAQMGGAAIGARNLTPMVGPTRPAPLAPQAAGPTQIQPQAQRPMAPAPAAMQAQVRPIAPMAPMQGPPMGGRIMSDKHVKEALDLGVQLGRHQATKHFEGDRPFEAAAPYGWPPVVPHGPRAEMIAPPPQQVPMRPGITPGRVVAPPQTSPRVIQGPIPQAAPMPPPPGAALASAGRIPSDERIKEHDPADAFLEHLVPHTYRYKDPRMEPAAEPTGGHYLGVMAQDVERSPTVGPQLVKDTPRGKVIEGPAMLSALAAGSGRLYQHSRELEERLRSLEMRVHP